MREKLTKLVFEMGELPVKDKDEIDFVELSMFPGQIMVTKKGHKRTLEVNIIRGKNNDGLLFNINNSFAYFKPQQYEDKIEDNLVLSDPREFIRHDKIVFGRLIDQKGKDIVITYNKNFLHFNFYSLDYKMNPHTAEISLKYKPNRNLLEIIMIYDNKIKAEFDTNANYLLQDITKKSLFKRKEAKSGNLLSEQSNTLYLEDSMPVKVYAKFLK